MNKFTLNIPDEGKTISVPAGTVLMDALADAGFRQASECGGGGRCGKCRVVVSGVISAPSGLENKLLDSEDIASGVRLACQAIVTGDATLKFVSPVVSGGVYDYPMEFVSKEELCFEPPFEKIALTLTPPGNGDQRSDLRRVLDSIRIKNPVIPLSIIRELPAFLRENNFKIDLFTDDRYVTGVFPEGTGKCAGVAVDIGTTTVCARLVGLETGEVLASAITENPQRLYGADVASRITYTSENRGGRERLRNLAAETVNNLVSALVKKTGLSKRDIIKLTVVGNTTMLHIFLEIETGAIASAPYISPTAGNMIFSARELGIEASPGAIVCILPSVASYVGADAVAASVRVKLHEEKKPAVMIDLGTNAEIILTDGENFYACSAAAGPALEGAHIKHGMMASAGAVCRVNAENGLRVETIGNAPPAGLCGTGLLDSISECLKVGLISRDGRICDPENTQDVYGKLLTETDGMKEIIIYDPGETGQGARIVLTQKDIRQYQLAKGAMGAGLELLLKEAGMCEVDLEKIYLAGALGTALRAESAAGAGLLHASIAEKIYFAGNAALDGATEALRSLTISEDIRELATKIQYLELSASHGFTDIFVEKLKL